MEKVKREPVHSYSTVLAHSPVQEVLAIIYFPVTWGLVILKVRTKPQFLLTYQWLLSSSSAIVLKAHGLGLSSRPGPLKLWCACFTQSSISINKKVSKENSRRLAPAQASQVVASHYFGGGRIQVNLSINLVVLHDHSLAQPQDHIKLRSR